MSPAIGIFFWIGVVVFCAICAGVAWLLFRLARRKQAKNLMLFAAIPLGIFTLLTLLSALLLATILASGPSETNNPAVVKRLFHEQFGFEPEAALVDAHASDFNLLDAGRLYLRFQADANTVTRIADKAFKPIEAKEFTALVSSRPDRPAWWVTPTNSAKFYRADQWKGHFRSNMAYVCYDEASGTVYFLSLGAN